MEMRGGKKRGKKKQAISFFPASGDRGKKKKKGENNERERERKKKP